MNYRVIAVSILDGTTYDVAEFRDFADVLNHAAGITRWDVHCFVVNIGTVNGGDVNPDAHEEIKPYVMSTILQTGAKR